ncbi:MAG: acyl-CoA thioester hydrolase [Solirubrobacteraceae bacterium]|jgi:acyl-CoA thioester hydrolase|nr:acyl-CoA thioester hydrolase [Solirubrobacteraceae bacterium]
MRKFQHVFRVRYGECDPQGIVFNANYLLYCDVAYTELWRAAGVPWTAMTDMGFDAVLAETTLRFRAPARFDDEIAMSMTIPKLGTSSIVTAFELHRGSELLVEGELRHVVVSAETWRPAPMPDAIRAALQVFSA